MTAPRFFKLIGAALCTLALASSYASAQAQSVSTEIIGGVVVVRGEIHGDRGTVQANFILDLGSAPGLIVPKDRAAALGLDTAKPMEISLGDLQLKAVSVREADIGDLVGKLTADYAGDLRQVPVAGIIGLGAFANRSLRLDQGAKTLEVDVVDDPAVTATRVTLAADQTFTLETTRVGLRMLQYESLIAKRAVGRIRPGTSDANPVRLGSIDLIASDAFRIADLGNDETSPDLLLGVRLLSSFRLTIDAAHRVFAFEPLRAIDAQPEEQAFFLALDSADDSAITRFVAANPQNRHFNEAAMTLLALRANAADGSQEPIREAVEMLASSFPLDRRSHRLVEMADQLLDQPSDRSTLIVGLLLDVAAPYADKDLDARAIHEIHARRGLLAMRAGDWTSARGQLISAAYGLPGDPKVNTWLGDLYRHLEQPLQAWSRYLDVALAQRPTAAAMRGLDELGRDEAFRKSLPVSEVELMLEGRAPAFVPRSRRAPGAVPTARLVELFVDDANGGSVGQELAFDGLRRHFEGSNVQFLAFHLGPAGNTELAMRRARLYGIASLPTLLADGEALSSVPAAADGAAALFDEYAGRLTRRASEPATQATTSIEAQSKSTDEGLSVTIRLGGVDAARAEGSMRLFAFLSENRVFATGGNGTAMHYAVARAVIGDAEGVVVDPRSNGTEFELRLSREELSRSEANAELARQRRATAIPAMKTAPVDLDQCRVIVVLQDSVSRRVIAAAVAQPPSKAGDP